MDNYYYVDNGVYYDGCLWFSSYEGHQLATIDVNSGRIEFKMELACENIHTIRPYYNVISNESGELIFIPGNSEKILKVDTKSEKQILYDYRDSAKKIDGNIGKFTCCVKQDKKILLFPGTMHYVLSIDPYDMTFEYYDNIIRDIDMAFGKELNWYFGDSSVQLDHKLLLFGRFFNFLLEIDLDTGKYTICKMENETDVNGFKDMAVYEEKLFLTNNAFHVLEYDIQTKKLQKILQTDQCYSMVKACEAGVWLIPAYDNKFARYSPKQNRIEEIPYPSEFSYAIEKAGKVLFHSNVEETDDRIFIVPRFENMLTTIDKTEGKIDFIPLTFGKSVIEYFSRISNGILEENKVINNYTYINMSSFLEYVKNSNYQVKQDDQQDAGKRIHIYTTGAL